MVFRTKSKRSKKKRFKLDFSDKTTRLALGVIVVLALAIPLSIGLGLFSVFINRPAAGSATGYATFQLIDSEYGNRTLDGQIALVLYADDGELSDAGIVNTGETVHIEQSVLAVIYNITDDNLDDRTFLPFTIVPTTSGTEDDPSVNTIWVYFLSNTDNVTDVEIVDLDGTPGDYDESDLTEDVEHDITLNITVEARGGVYNYSYYGVSSYVPEYMLPELNLNNSVNGFGLFMYFIGAEIVEETVIVNDFPGNGFYCPDLDMSIIRLHPVYGTGEYSETLTFELKQQPSETGIFQGFLTDFNDTKIQISV